jgi:hypothetical protein
MAYAHSLYISPLLLEGVAFRNILGIVVCDSGKVFATAAIVLAFHTSVPQQRFSIEGTLEGPWF